MTLSKNAKTVLITIGCMVGAPVCSAISQQLSDGHFDWAPVGTTFFTMLVPVLLWLRLHYGADITVEQTTQVVPTSSTAAQVTTTTKTTMKQAPWDGKERREDEGDLITRTSGPGTTP